MNKDFLSWLGHAGSHTCMIENAGTTCYFVRVQKNEDFDYLYCQRQYSGKELARGGHIQICWYLLPEGWQAV